MPPDPRDELRLYTFGFEFATEPPVGIVGLVDDRRGLTEAGKIVELTLQVGRANLGVGDRFQGFGGEGAVGRHRLNSKGLTMKRSDSMQSSKVRRELVSLL
jgi:hypothetical protein